MYSFLLLSLIVLTVTGLIFYRSWLNPVTVFNLIWFVVCSLYGLRLSPALQPYLADKTCQFLLLGNLVFTISCILVSKVSFKTTNINEKNKEQIIIPFSKIQIHFWIWIVLEILETIYSKGFPIIWALKHNGKSYFDYGIPTIHGLANAYGLSILTILAYQLFTGKFKNKTRKIKFCIAILIAMYIFMLTRQVIISAILQVLIVYCFVKKRIPWIKLIISLLLMIVAFGILGNIRTGYTEFLTVAMVDTKIHPLLVGFYWVYMYLTMTIANLNKLFTLSFAPAGVGYFIQIYLPTVIGKSFFKGNYVDPSIFLVTQAFNVSGYNADAYISLGLLGLILMALIYGVLGGNLYKKVLKQYNMKNIIYYAIYFQIMILSFFYNQLFYLPSGFQFIIIFLLFRNERKKYECKNRCLSHSSFLSWK